MNLISKVLPSRKDHLSPLLHKYISKLKSLTDQTSKELSNGVFDKDFKNFEIKVLNWVNRDLLAKLSHPQNLIFDLILEYILFHNYSEHYPLYLKEMVSSYLLRQMMKRCYGKHNEVDIFNSSQLKASLANLLKRMNST